MGEVTCDLPYLPRVAVENHYWRREPVTGAAAALIRRRGLHSGSSHARRSCALLCTTLPARPVRQNSLLLLLFFGAGCEPGFASCGGGDAHAREYLIVVYIHPIGTRRLVLHLEEDRI